jgi:hypothetical protein
VRDSVPWRLVDSVLTVHRGVTPADSARVARMVRDQWQAKPPDVLESGAAPQQLATGVGAAVGLFLVGLASLASAALTGRGPLLRAAGLEVVGRSGLPVGRVRRIGRSAVTSVAVGVLVAIMAFDLVAHLGFQAAVTGDGVPAALVRAVVFADATIGVIAVVVGLGLALGVLAEGRTIGDRVAGTWLVPE